MKKLFSSLSMRARIAFLTVMAGLTTVPAMAQDDPISSAILDQTTTGLQNIVPRVMAVLKVITLVGGGIALFMIIMNIIGGERDAAKKAGWWLVGMVLGFIVFTIIGNAAADVS